MPQNRDVSANHAVASRLAGSSRRSQTKMEALREGWLAKAGHLARTEVIVDLVQPNRLPREPKFFATEIFPARLDRKPAHFGK